MWRVGGGSTITWARGEGEGQPLFAVLAALRCEEDARACSGSHLGKGARESESRKLTEGEEEVGAH